MITQPPVHHPHQHETAAMNGRKENFPLPTKQRDQILWDSMLFRELPFGAYGNLAMKNHVLARLRISTVYQQ